MLEPILTTLIVVALFCVVIPLTHKIADEKTAELIRRFPPPRRNDKEKVVNG